jgi:ectoine hydroxylase-related dioxygenase (phytanoyl-CoA dioxygenase family)
MLNCENILDEIINSLKTKGYAIVPNVLTHDEITNAKELFYKWKEQIDSSHSMHGIYKYHHAGHQEHAWFIRTRHVVQNVFKVIWETMDVVSSMDGCCYIPKECEKKDTCWTHTDQGPHKKGLACYQGFVSLTNNKERTLVVYEGSHLIHEEYFKNKIVKPGDWHLIEKMCLDEIADSKKTLIVPAGSLVLWDSRTFHQNQYGLANSEERIVQYVCFLPKYNKQNSEIMYKKRLKYYNERRTTSHWPYPISVIPMQPRTYVKGPDIIDYSELPLINLSQYHEEILKII